MSNSQCREALDFFGSVRRKVNLLATAALRPLDIGTKQAIILREIHARKLVSLAELSKSTDTDPASTGKIIDSLIRRKWVKRSDDPADRRRWLISLTESGIDTTKQIEKLIQTVAIDFTKPLSVQERSELVRLLQLISSHLEQALESTTEEYSS